MLSETPQEWVDHAGRDFTRDELVDPETGKVVTYEQLLAIANPDIAKQVNIETFGRKYEAINRGLDDLRDRFAEAKPDVVVMFGDDQSEWFFDDNYPSIHVYWGDKIRKVARRPRGEMAGGNDEAAAPESSSFYRVDSELGLYIIESLMARDFDVAHSKYQRETYGGSIGPSVQYHEHLKRNSAPRPFGIPHAYGVPIDRWFVGEPEIVPITINTCYPPNWISPRRAYALGRAVHDAMDAWGSDKRVAFACSGGLSHYVVDEVLDRAALKGLSEANPDVLTTLPRQRLQSAATETLNWVACGGAMGDEKMEVITYEPCYRTPAGSGVGVAVGSWMV
jgi:hypothetical protein